MKKGGEKKTTKNAMPVLEMGFFALLFLVSHLNWHQTASNSAKQTLIQWWCEEGCRYFTKWRYMTKCSLRLTTAEEVSGFLYPHHSLPAHPLLLQTTLGKKGELFWISVTPASKSYIDLYYYANSGCHGVYAKKPRRGRNISAGGLWLKCSPLPVL